MVCARQTQTGPSAVKVGTCYISGTRSWVKPTIWLPSPPIVLTTHAGAQLQNKSSRGHYALLITFWTEVVQPLEKDYIRLHLKELSRKFCPQIPNENYVVAN